MVIAAPRRLAVRVTPDARRQIRGGHPWVYAESITSSPADGAAGDLAVIFDDRRRFVAIGLYDPSSPIRVRILAAGRPVPIDRDWWRDRVRAAHARRHELAVSTTTTAYRVVHGENDGLPGLVVDRYGDVAVLKVYTAALLPHLEDLTAAVAAALQPRSIVLRLGRSVAGPLPAGLADGASLQGPLPSEPVGYLENALRLRADVVRGQKTGAFLDQRENRALVGRLGPGLEVLDVFTCTGGFALHAAAGGARSVHLVDQSAAAVAAATANRALNLDQPAVAVCPFTSTVGDAFDVMAALAGAGRRFDLVVVDPPSFAPSRAHMARAIRAYRRLSALALDLVRPGGVLFQASCSSHVTADDFAAAVHAQAAADGVAVEELARTGQPLDHPIGFPQGAYLKALLLRRERGR